jgi:hypothetical protein
MNKDSLALRGCFHISQYRDSELITEMDVPNAITTEGKAHLLGAGFASATQISAWYVGLIDSIGYTALSAADIYDNIDEAGNGWDEFADYTDFNNTSSATTRPLWTGPTVTGTSITNPSTKCVYDITAAGTIKGLFVAGGANAQLKSNSATGNILWSAALFSLGDVAVQIGDQLKVTYTLSA